MAVRAFDPAPSPKSGKPAAPASFSVTPSGKADMETGGPQPEMAAVSKGNPAKKGDGSKNFVKTKVVNGGPKGGLARVAGVKDVIPEDVRSFNVKP